MGLQELVEYLVRLKLADHRKALCVLSLASQDVPWSEIYEKCDVFRNEVKGYIARAREKMGNGNRTLVIIKHVIPLLSDIQPIVVNNRCTICNIDLYHPQVALMHLYYRHRDIVDYYTQRVVSKLIEIVNGDKNFQLS